MTKLFSTLATFAAHSQTNGEYAPFISRPSALALRPNYRGLHPHTTTSQQRLTRPAGHDLRQPSSALFSTYSCDDVNKSCSVYPIGDTLKRLQSLRNTPTDERFEQLDHLPINERRQLLECRESCSELLSHMISEYPWADLQVDTLPIGGAYAFSLLANLAYMCSYDTSDATTTRAYDALTAGGWMPESILTSDEPNPPYPPLSDDIMCHRMLMLTRDNEVILSIRGTQSNDDWLTNFRMRPISGENLGLTGQYHRGYCELVADLWDTLKVRLEQLQQANPDKPIRIGLTTHSAGGPMGLMLAQIFNNAGYNVERVVTFGAVRGMDEAACDAYEHSKLDDRTLRVFNFVDIGPYVWPNLQHPASHELYLTHNGQYLYNPTPKEVSANQRRRFSPCEALAYGTRLREHYDHHMIHYAKILAMHAGDKVQRTDDRGPMTEDESISRHP